MAKEKKEKEGYWRTRHGKREWVSEHSQSYKVKNPKISQKNKSKVIKGKSKQLIQENPDILSLETEAEIISLLDKGYEVDEVVKLAECEIENVQKIQKQREELSKNPDIEGTPLKKLSKTTKVELFFENK